MRLTFFFSLLALSCTTTMSEIPPPAVPRPECDGSGPPLRAENRAVVLVFASTLENGRVTSEAVGYGTVIGRDGLILTSSILVPEGSRVHVASRQSGAKHHLASVYDRSPEKGVVLLQAYELTAESPTIIMPVQTAHGVLSEGESAWVAADHDSWLLAPVWNAWTKFSGASPVVELKTSGVLPGAPVVNVCGEMIGLVVVTSPKHESVFATMLSTAFKGLGIRPAKE